MVIKEGRVTVYSYEDMPQNVDCFVTTRHTGYSAGNYASLNFGLNTQDDSRTAVKNIELLKNTFNIRRLANLNQVHGNIVHEVTSENFNDLLFSDGDGLFTLEKGIGLGIMTADCYNVFLAGEKAVCALHCGHRSVSSNIMGEAIKIFRKHGDFPVFAGIGPGISADNYQVGKELADQFREICPRSVTMAATGLYLNIRAVIEDNLTMAGIKNIEHIRNCTFADENLYSHRRDKGVTGRMMGVIVRR